MLERIKNALQERKRDEKGFSLVELAVVIVIIGILVAIAVPVFANVQKSANDAAASAAAANGSAQIATEVAASPDTVASAVDLTGLVTGKITKVVPTGNDLTDFCVTVTYTGGNEVTKAKGPGC